MLFESNSEDGGEDGLYYGYVPTTVDAGNTPLVIISLVVCALTFLAVPLTVTLIRRHQHGSDETNAHAGPTDSDDSHDVEGNVFELSEDMDEPNVLDVGAGIRRRRRGAARADNVVKRRLQVQRGIAEECRTSAIRRQTEEEKVAGVSIVINHDGVETHQHSPPPSPQRRGDRPTQNKVTTWRQKLSQSVDFYLDLASYDDEARRILRLAVPFTASALIETVLDLVELAIISFHLGTEAMVAFALVDIIVGTSSEFMGGFIESVSSLTSMASGAGNNHLCGEYLQISTGFYFLFQIPFVFVWSFAVGPIMLLMGFDEYTSSIANDFGRVAIFIDIVGGISEGFYDFLEVIDHETFANIMGCIEACVETGLIALFAIKTSADLVTIGLVMIVNVCFFFLLNIAIAVNKGWLKAFKFGLIGRCAFRNRAAVRQVVKTAVPLAFGSLMAYAEWEILTVFAAFMGPAEAASWAILSFLWDTFEATTEGIGDAAEVRCAYHLGKNRPGRAKRSSYKSIHLAAILALIATSIVLIMRDDIPTWLTSDPTLQHMLAQQIPLIGVGVSYRQYGDYY